jgi:hypothetical protein
MRNAAFLTLASPAMGFGLESALVGPINRLLLGRYPAVVSTSPAAGDPAGLAWLSAILLLAAAIAALVAPRVLRVPSISGRAVGALAFVGSLVTSLALTLVVFYCATVQPSSPPIHDAAQALSHAGRCLSLALAFAQVLVALTFVLVRGHIGRDLPPSTYSQQGYAALTQR